MIHLGWHEDLRNESFSAPYCWVEVVGLEPAVREAFIEWMLTLWQLNKSGGIPYGFDMFVEDHFDLSGKYNGIGSGTGLTCATFVLSCFAKWGIVLLDHATWPLRPEDKLWQQWASNAVVRRAGAAHGLALANLVGTVARFRPEEVAAGASAFIGAPMKFAEADRVAQGLVTQMRGALLD